MQKVLGKQVILSVGFLKLETPINLTLIILKLEPYLFKRDVNEGGYIIKRDIQFNQDTKIATIEDFKYNTTKEVSFGDVQDMISAFYYLRTINTDTIKAGDEIDLNMFFDSKTFAFKLTIFR